MSCILPSYCTLLDLPKRSASHQKGALVSPATSLGHQHSCHSPSKQHHAATLTQPGHTTSPAAQSLKTMSSGSPFKCCTNSHIYTLFRESFTLIHTLPISWQSLIIHSDTNQVSNMCSSSYVILIIAEAGGSNEKQNMPLNQENCTYCVFVSFYF